MDGLTGAQTGQPRGHYDIYYRQGWWDGSSTYTVLHETYEIIHETFCDMESDYPPERKVCREADRRGADAAGSRRVLGREVPAGRVGPTAGPPPLPVAR